MNLVHYFKGAIRLAGFTRRALSPAEFLKIDDKSGWSPVLHACSSGETLAG
jgi:hypothetical protein